MQRNGYEGEDAVCTMLEVEQITWKLLPPQTTLPAMPPQPERPLEKFPGY